MQVNNVQNITVPAGQNAGIAGATGEFSFWDTLGDFVDIINPLQHIPIVSTIYRGITGDTMGSVANVVGGTLFGGPIGGAFALAGEVANEVINGDEQSIETALVQSSTQDISKAQNASNAYKHIRVTTEDWLNPNFNSYA